MKSPTTHLSAILGRVKELRETRRRHRLLAQGIESVEIVSNRCCWPAGTGYYLPFSLRFLLTRAVFFAYVSDSKGLGTCNSGAVFNRLR